MLKSLQLKHAFGVGALAVCLCVGVVRAAIFFLVGISCIYLITLVASQAATAAANRHLQKTVGLRA